MENTVDHAAWIAHHREDCHGDWTALTDAAALDELAHHLREAGQSAELHALLLDDPAWKDHRTAHGGADAYIRDLDTALAVFNDPLDADGLRMFMQLQTARLVADATLRPLDSDDVTVLVYFDRLDEALDIARKSEGWYAFKVLVRIHKALVIQGRVQIGLLDEAYSHLGQVDNIGWRIQLQKQIIHLYLEQGLRERADALFEEALAWLGDYVYDPAEIAYKRKSGLKSLFTGLHTLAECAVTLGKDSLADVLFGEAAALLGWELPELTHRFKIITDEGLELIHEDKALGASEAEALIASLKAAGRHEQAKAVPIPEGQNVIGRLVADFLDNSTPEYDERVHRALKKQAADLVAEGAFDAAHALIERMHIDLYRADRADAACDLIEAMHRAGQVREAAALAESLLETYQATTRSFTLTDMGYVLWLCGMSDESRQAFERAFETGAVVWRPVDRKMHMVYLAERLAQIGERAQAEKVFYVSRVNENIPWLRADALCVIVDALLQVDAVEEAITFARAADGARSVIGVEATQQVIERLFALGRYDDMKAMIEATRWWEGCTRLNIWAMEAFCHAGEMARMAYHHDQAMMKLSRLKDYHHLAEIWSSLIKVMQDCGWHEQLIQLLDERPRDEDGTHTDTTLDYFLRWGYGREAFARMGDRAERRSTLRLKLVLALIEQGDMDRARALFETIEPTYRKQSAYYFSLEDLPRRIEIHRRLGQVDRASEELNTAIQASIQQRYIISYWEIQQFLAVFAHWDFQHEAFTALVDDICTRYQPSNALDVLAEIGAMCAKLGYPAAARRVLERAQGIALSPIVLTESDEFGWYNDLEKLVKACVQADCTDVAIPILEGPFMGELVRRAEAFQIDPSASRLGVERFGARIAELWARVGDMPRALRLDHLLDIDGIDSIPLAYAPWLVHRDYVVGAFAGFQKKHMWLYRIGWWNKRISTGVHEFDRDSIEDVFGDMRTAHLELWFLFLHKMRDAFESHRAGMTLTVMLDAMRLIQWIHPDWQALYAEVSALDERA